MQAPGGMSERDERPGPPQRKKRKDEGRVVGYEANRYNEDEAVMPLLVLLLLLLLLSPVVGDGKAVVKYGEVDKESVADGSDDEDMVVCMGEAAEASGSCRCMKTGQSSRPARNADCDLG